MTPPRGLRFRAVAGILLLGVLAAAGLPHHEDLAGGIPGAPLERVVSRHSPLSHGEHWHSGVRVKDDPCLACHNSRAAGVTAEPCRDVPLSFALLRVAFAPLSLASTGVESHGSRGPPALL